MFRLRKRVFSILIALVVMLSSTVYAFANTSGDELNGTWYPGIAPNDTISPFSGYITDSNGNTEILTKSPFNGHNIITSEEIKEKNKSGINGIMTPQNWYDGDYYYEYISNSYTQTSSNQDPYHFNTGHTQVYNGNTLPGTLSYKQSTASTSNWSVTAQVSSTAGLKQNFLDKLAISFGGSYSKSTTTQKSNEILYTMQVPPMKTGYIYAWLPGAYSYGTARYSEYLLDINVGTYFATGRTVTTSEGGWAPLNDPNVYVLNFTSYSN